MIGEDFTIGASYAGVPGVVIGRTKNFAWAITAPLQDNADLWREEISEDGLTYTLDGEQRPLKKTIELIKVKGEEEPVEFALDYTHRGPVFTSETIKQGALLFGGELPSLQKDEAMSLVWGGSYGITADPMVKFVQKTLTVSGVKEMMDFIDETNKDGWTGCPINLVMADTKGDIGYMMLTPSPRRKDRTPFLGSRVLDGTTSAWDWEGILPTTDLPRSFNPKKGYIVTANNRQTPDNAAYDIGAALLVPARAIRIDEIIRNGIAEGKKFTEQDMSDI